MATKCTSCGFANDDTSKRCTKCGSHIQSQNFANPFKLKFKVDNTKYFNCKSCNYILAENQLICPNCNYNNGEKAPEPTPVPEPAPMPKTGSTISFGDFNYNNKSGFQLIPHSHDSKDEILSYRGADVVLNRKTIDPSDHSLSEENHARFFQEDGKWYIQNNSSNAALFVQVNGTFEIKSDSVVIMGQSKVFTFVSNQKKA